jgi:hypothetical protein
MINKTQFPTGILASNRRIEELLFAQLEYLEAIHEELIKLNHNIGIPEETAISIPIAPKKRGRKPKKV